MTFTVHTGDALTVLRSLEPESVNCCVTSPPYWGLRDYGVDGQIGLEESLGAFLDRLVAVFDEVARVLRKDGTCWVNMGDSYAASSLSNRSRGKATPRRNGHGKHQSTREIQNPIRRPAPAGIKPKDLIGQPWRLAFALQDAGWYLRSDIIWSKSNPMPESVVDRPTRSHEYLFLLTRSAKYAYDADAIRTPLRPKTFTTFGARRLSRLETRDRYVKTDNFAASTPERKPRRNENGTIAGANRRTVWAVATKPYRGAHFATFPPKLVEPCILAGCPEGGVVLDPFAGSGTTGEVAIAHGRSFVGIELSPTYADMARERCERARRAGRQLQIEGVA